MRHALFFLLLLLEHPSIEMRLQHETSKLRAAIFQARVVTAPTYRGGKPRGPSHAWDDAVLAKHFELLEPKWLRSTSR